MSDKDIAQEIHDNVKALRIVLLGVPHTADKGMVHDIKELKDNCIKINAELHEMNGKVRDNTAWRKALVWVVGILSILAGLTAGGVLPPS